MSYYKPPVTGDAQMDSFLFQVSETLASMSGTGLSGSVTEQLQAAGVTAGANALTLVLYKRSLHPDVSLVEDMDVDTVYDYEANTLVATDDISVTVFNGWSRFYQPRADGRALYAIQVNISSSSNLEYITSTDWSEPVLVLDAEDIIESSIKTNNGTALRTPTDTTTLSVMVTRNSVEQTVAAHQTYEYKWTNPDGNVLCVDANLNVLSLGEVPIVATGIGQDLVCSVGTPAYSDAYLDVHGSNLREIIVGTEDVDKSQSFLVEVSNIPD